ncbi:MerR family transcriptional regulator [Streptodolium elevatio]|uniref:MerR family transcriptional regulator n=1 Tax=Streptodolium elevatio TaxID=3157996 RepID=A0ABV3DWY4_9ACTN
MTAEGTFGRLDDDADPVSSTGRAAETLSTTQGSLRAIGDARLIAPLRSAGRTPPLSRHQLRIAARGRELVDRRTKIEAACRIVILQDQLEEAGRINAEDRRVPEPGSHLTRTLV